MRCDLDDREAVIDQPYNGTHLCESHFERSVRDRARRELHRQFPRFKGGTVAVALSGGKDSASVLVLAQEYFQRRPNVRLVAITVDEGIRGYRPATIRAASRILRPEIQNMFECSWLSASRPVTRKSSGITLAP